ncbi:MAG: hypothetical protein NTZ05_11285 [Chloroflexi bacterium]|nr:hypothetical protein [Chloroflexota bacterium]
MQYLNGTCIDAERLTGVGTVTIIALIVAGGRRRRRQYGVCRSNADTPGAGGQNLGVSALALRTVVCGGSLVDVPFSAPQHAGQIGE